MNTFTVRTIADGDHYFEPRTFDFEYMADSFYSSTVSRLQREDSPGVEVTVALIDDETGHVVYERTFPRV